MAKVLRHSIIGGLGNQLFCLAAALFAWEKQGGTLKLYVDTSKQPNILDLVQLPSEVIVFRQRGIFMSLCNLYIRLFRYLYRVQKVFHFKSHLIFVADSIGFEKTWDMSKNYKLVEGYFQSYIYPNSLKNHPIQSLIQPDLVPSEKFNLKNLEQVIAIHIRRGDYKNPENYYFGQLSEKYYYSAISILTNKKVFRKIIVFSDEISKVKCEFVGLQDFGLEVVWVDESFKLTTCEEFMLFSRAGGKVIGNSTFSWWAAYLGPPGSLVTYPTKWFKYRENPLELIPHSWLAVESRWLNSIPGKDTWREGQRN